MSLKNLLKVKAQDSINIVYFKGKEKAHSIYLPYKLFSFIKTVLIVCLIWLPISLVLLYYILSNENSTTQALSKSKEVVLNYQDKIDGIFENLYASSDPDNTSPSPATTSDPTTVQQVPQIPSSFPSTQDTISLEENPMDIELNYNKIDSKTLNIDLKITNKNSSLSSTTGRLLVALILNNDNQEESYLLYPKDIISSVIPHVKKGEPYKISRFKEIHHNFSIPEGFSLKAIKVLVYNTQSQSSIEKQLDL